VLTFSFPSPAQSKDFERFDAQIYNGQFYPLVDNIEWGEQQGEENHMEFHLHSKEKVPMDVSVVAGNKGGRPVLWIMYVLNSRGEKVCRHVLAPSQFKEGMKIYAYRDNSDPDYDNVFFYSAPPKKLLSAVAVNGKKAPVPEYTMPAYERCTDENASNMPYPKGQEPAKVAETPVVPARDPAAKTPIVPAAPQVRGSKGVPIDYDNTAVPFSF
jgi:hypothetical protein